MEYHHPAFWLDTGAFGASALDKGLGASTTGSMQDLPAYFDDKRLVKLLCRKRIEAARKARRMQFIRSVSATPRKVPPPSELNAMLPPRRVWNSFRPSAKTRAELAPDAPAKLAHTMARHVLNELKRAAPRFRWVSRLRKFLDAVRQRALNWTATDSFTFDHVYAFPKNKPGNGQKYRIVAAYSLSSSLICGGFAAYLRDRIDEALNGAVLAFRSPPTDGSAPPCHHDAVEQIVRLVDSTSPGASLWCAEVDIEGFFDAVSHEVAIREARRLLSWSGHDVDNRLFGFLESFLGGYAYAETLGPAQARLAKIGVTAPKFADPLKALRERGIATTPTARIGIPQGSAMSCVLANIVISAADSLVCAYLEARGEKGEGLYLRYCDDIVITNPAGKQLTVHVVNGIMFA